MILACQSISKAFGIDEILNDISFHIEAGEKLAIVGINGSGKTTLLKIIMGEETADSGQVVVAKDTTIGYLSQHQDISFDNTVYAEMLSAETDCDHIHMLVSMPPDLAPSKLVATLKTQLSKEIRSVYKEQIEKQLWGGAFWSSSYFIATTGTTVLENVKKYIESQRTDEHKRKYEKTGKYSKKNPQ